MSVSGVHEIWPEGVGNNTRYGYIDETITIAPGEDGSSKIQTIVRSWQRTAHNHNFFKNNAQWSFSVVKSQEVSDQYIITTKKEKSTSEQKKITVIICKITAAANVDESPEDTDISITIEGINVSTNKRFTLDFSVYRSPTVRVCRSYWEKV